ncbi:phosphoribosylformylglycinamidine synthase [Thozetella sp. PMI_491]|nr:phosphoribosylformylglycinamidine synthase [Thozetella sp. PMI_491]
MPRATFLGDSCYTVPEASKLLQRIQREAGELHVTAISGKYHYYADLKSPDCDLQALRQLLQVPEGSGNPQEPAGNSVTVYIHPRNISPWSSQASLIAEVVGLRGHVRRIERGRVVTITFNDSFEGKDLPFKDIIYDRMTETMEHSAPDLDDMFAQRPRRALEVIDIFAPGSNPATVLAEYNAKKGLSLDPSEIEYLVNLFSALGRPPHDIELFSFAQVNSEHCRHKTFNAAWTIDGKNQGISLFEMIKNTHKQNPDFTVSAYSDNAAVIQGEPATFWAPEYTTGVWKLNKEVVHVLAKVETHNHPTAISPFPGAATGSGGEIRDEGAVGRGSQPKAGLCGFWVSELLIPDHPAPWEVDYGKPAHYASSLDIMLEAPIGSARFNNEFGRPCLSGCFRTLLINSGDETPDWRGYHKPIMIAGGVGTVRPENALKRPEDVQDGAHVIVLGGPAMLIGLGGGAASSSASAEATADLDFDSVQRGNPEMERRAQMVINTCVSLGEQNPIAMIHDVGAGGLSNALPELVKDAGFGGKFELRQVDSADSSMSPMEIWANEAQERYVLLVNRENMNRFVSICQRERCGFSDVGTVVSKDDSGAARLIVTDRESNENPIPIDLPIEALFPPGRRQERVVESVERHLKPFNTMSSLEKMFGKLSTGELIAKATELVFNLPAVGSKMFLITIGDRTVGGLTVQDQLVGPWQVPVADVAVTQTSFSLDDKTRRGEAMAMGEKPILALISPAASARMAVVESLMNLGAADIMGDSNTRGDLRRVKLSANWMVAVNHPGEGAALYEAVKAIGLDLCPQLGVSIPVGKDSTSMKASWADKDSGESKAVTAPVSVVISAFTVVEDVRRTWTPQLRRVEEVGESILLFVDLAGRHKAMGGSALAQCLGQLGNEAPDVRDAELVVDYFDALSQLHEEGIVLAYHDRSDGGLITTLAEMMFAGRCGVDLSLDYLAKSPSTSDILETLFNEELGAVFQVRKADEKRFIKCFATCGPPPRLITKIGFVQPKSKPSLTIRFNSMPIVNLDRAVMQQWWSRTSFEMQKLRDNPACAQAEFDSLADSTDPGLSYNIHFDPSETGLPVFGMLRSLVARPRVAILREQGVNGFAEMAFAFRAAGFEAVDVTVTDIIGGQSLAGFRGLAACGGFSYGDVLGAGQGWAQSILMNRDARNTFQTFFNRPDTFTLGVCNGCQMVSKLKELIPGSENWPMFVQNTSQQFEARFSMVQIQENKPSVFLDGMNGSAFPIAVSHGEGRAQFSSPSALQTLGDDGLIPIRYVDNGLNVTEKYPFNPNGSPQGVAGVRSKDGRVLAMMPHPERTILPDTASYVPPNLVESLGQFGPWIKLFRNARRWVG